MNIMQDYAGYTELVFFKTIYHNMPGLKQNSEMYHYSIISFQDSVCVPVSIATQTVDYTQTTKKVSLPLPLQDRCFTCKFSLNQSTHFAVNLFVLLRI